MRLSRSKPRLLLTVFLLLTAIIVQAQGEPAPASTPDILDAMIAIVIILFILSVIVEKITQLIRKYSPFIKPSKSRSTGLATVWRNIGKKQTGDDKEIDKKIEREVNSLSFVVGLLIAIAFRVDLFKMFKAADPREVLFWSKMRTPYSDLEMALFVVSIGLTGFFLTFGSKFFHDLLDTLFQVKNLKRKLADENTGTAEDIQQFDEYIDASYTSLIERAIRENESILQAPGMIGKPMHGKMMKEGRLIDCIDIHLAGSDSDGIPSTVSVKLSKGQVVRFPVHLVYNVGMPAAHALQGDDVSASAHPDFKGTVCCKLKRADGAELLLTCSHVIDNGSKVNRFGVLKNPVPAILHGGRQCNFTWAICNEEYDLAMIAGAPVSFNYIIEPLKPRPLKPSDILSTRIRVVRQNGKIAEGRIVNYRCPSAIPVQYSDGELGLRNLIILSQVDEDGSDRKFTSLTIDGDSGACVYDERNHPVGMIVAGNDMFSYAISLTDILKRTDSTISA